MPFFSRSTFNRIKLGGKAIIATTINQEMLQSWYQSRLVDVHFLVNKLSRGKPEMKLQPKPLGPNADVPYQMKSTFM